MPGHQHDVPRAGEVEELGHLVAAHRGRLLHEDVLAGVERPPCQLVVGRHRCRDDDGLEAVVREQLVEVSGRACARVATGEAVAPLVRRVADPGKVGELVEVPDEVLAPVAEARLAYPHRDGHSFQIFSDVIPARPSALRRSTTSRACTCSAA